MSITFWMIFIIITFAENVFRVHVPYYYFLCGVYEHWISPWHPYTNRQTYVYHSNYDIAVALFILSNDKSACLNSKNLLLIQSQFLSLSHQIMIMSTVGDAHEMYNDTGNGVPRIWRPSLSVSASVQIDDRCIVKLHRLIVWLTQQDTIEYTRRVHKITKPTGKHLSVCRW